MTARRGRPPKAKLEGEAVTPAPASTPAKLGNLASIVATFQERYPDEWEAIRIGPCYYGLEQMIALLDD